MKNLRTIACCVSISILSLAASAQPNEIPLNEPDLKKPELFKQQPEKVAVDVLHISTLLNTQVGEPILLNLPSFRFEGTVIAAVSKYNNSIQSVVVRSTNYEGATLTVSRTSDENGNIMYTGRIISMKHGDLYQLKQEESGLALVKNKFYSVINE